MSNGGKGLQIRFDYAIQHHAACAFNGGENTPSNATPTTVQKEIITSTAPDCGFDPIEPKVTIHSWLQVVLSHLINFNSFGYILSFGIFQGYYTEVLGFDPSNVSWIGTVQLFLLFFVGVFSGRAMDAGYYRYTLTAGITFQLVGVFTTSICREYYQLFLAQGLCQGLGNGLLFCPAIALVSNYFPARKRAVALSLVACGGATGGMVFPAIAQSLLPKVGFDWTLRVMGFVMLCISAITLPFSRPNLKPQHNKPLIDQAAFREVPFILFCIGVFLAFWGLFFAYYYVRPFGQGILHISPNTSFDTILVINCFGIPGRIIPGILADRYFGSLNVFIPFVLINGALLYVWITISSTPGYFFWIAAYGFFAGGCQSLFQSASAKFSPNPRMAGIRIGMVCTFVSFACLSGPPIAGRLVEHMSGRYLSAQLFGGSSMILGSIVLLSAAFNQKT
jgi:MFS family permease